MSLNCSKKKLGKTLEKTSWGKKKKKKEVLQSPSLQTVKYSLDQPIPGVAEVSKSQSQSRQMDSAMLIPITTMCNRGQSGLKEDPLARQRGKEREGMA